MTKETREHVRNILNKMFTQRDYTTLTVKDLIKVANMSRSSFYYQFSSLEEAYSYAINKNVGNDIFEKSECCQDVIEQMADYIEKNKQLCLNFFKLTKTEDRHTYMYKKINNYLQNEYSNLFVKYSEDKRKILVTELDILTECFIFYLEMWFQKNLEDDKLKIVLILKRHVDVFDKTISEVN